MEAEKEWSKRQDLFFAKCAEWVVNHHGENVVDWGIVPDEIIDEGIDIYFGPTSDAEFYYDAVEKLDAGDYAQLIVNVGKNDTQNLDAAQELKKVIKEALVESGFTITLILTLSRSVTSRIIMTLIFNQGSHTNGC